MNERKKVFRWWWGWNPETIESWLEREEGLGWNLVDISSLGVNYSFIRGESRKVAYRFDFQAKAGYDYRRLLEDAGWSLVNEGSGWYYWRQEYSGRKPEMFTDVESLLDRNKRLTAFLLIFWVAQVLGILIVNKRSLQGTMGGFYAGLLVIQIALFLLYAVVMVRILIKNRVLRRNKSI
jgi:hypothetical protein